MFIFPLHILKQIFELLIFSLKFISFWNFSFEKDRVLLYNLDLVTKHYQWACSTTHFHFLVFSCLYLELYLVELDPVKLILLILNHFSNFIALLFKNKLNYQSVISYYGILAYWVIFTHVRSIYLNFTLPTITFP